MNAHQSTRISGWGNYPTTSGNIYFPERKTKHFKLPDVVGLSIARGAGRSYGDSAIAANLLATEKLNRFVNFDANTGVLTCEAGVTLDTILKVFVPKGWFLPVTPGTKFITVGGAVASDVHGKNHHVDGCFSEYVESVTLLIGEDLYCCSRSEHPDLFHATCGGMGLTGFILEVTFSLRSITSAYISQKTMRAENLAESLALFEQYAASRYSVAWIDCLATGASLGRSIVNVGEHSDDGALDVHKSPGFNIPCYFPGFVLNPLSVQAFNTLYYHKEMQKEKRSTVHYNPFFYPLDGIDNWNRMYGRGGFTQYQFAIPQSAGLAGLKEVLTVIAESKQGSFLAVLKAFGKGNDNLLSFPFEGYTLALDFKVTSKLWDLLDRLDTIVQRYGGRLYLTKDARMSESLFKATYSKWREFNHIRQKYGADTLYASMQSQRLGI